jgi:hypothetical protein
MFEHNVEGGRKVVKEGVIGRADGLKQEMCYLFCLLVSADIVPVQTYSKYKRAECSQWLLMWCMCVSRQSAVPCGVLRRRLGCISQGADAVQFSGSGPVCLHPFGVRICNYGSPLFHHNASG